MIHRDLVPCFDFKKSKSRNEIPMDHESWIMNSPYVVGRFGSANAVNVAPDGMTTYCRPSIVYVVGGP
jgi:hypothetical protein